MGDMVNARRCQAVFGNKLGDEFTNVEQSLLAGVGHCLWCVGKVER